MLNLPQCGLGTLHSAFWRVFGFVIGFDYDNFWAFFKKFLIIYEMVILTPLGWHLQELPNHASAHFDPVHLSLSISLPFFALPTNSSLWFSSWNFTVCGFRYRMKSNLNRSMQYYSENRVVRTTSAFQKPVPPVYTKTSSCSMLAWPFCYCLMLKTSVYISL